MTTASPAAAVAEALETSICAQGADATSAAVLTPRVRVKRDGEVDHDDCDVGDRDSDEDEDDSDGSSDVRSGARIRNRRDRGARKRNAILSCPLLTIRASCMK
jgi:hypothetical protein